MPNLYIACDDIVYYTSPIANKKQKIYIYMCVLSNILNSEQFYVT